ARRGRRLRSLLRCTYPRDRTPRRCSARVRAHDCRPRCRAGRRRAARAAGPHRQLRLCGRVRRARARDATPAGAGLHDPRARREHSAVAQPLRPRRDEGDADAGAGDAAARGTPMTGEEFVAALDAENRARLHGLEPDATLTPEVKGPLNVPNLLKVALRNEAEATLIAGRWLASCDDVKLMLALARQAADEAKHYELIARRLGELGFDADGFEPLAGGVGPLTRYLETLTTSV